jgi:predicted nucleic acid-binding protein
MNTGTLFDNNILIYHLNDQLGSAAGETVAELFRNRVCISVITRIEVLGWRGHTEASLASANVLLNAMEELPLDDPVIETTVRLRRSSRLRLPDAIIASTALVYDIPLVTRNTVDFREVTGLAIVNPFE